MANKIRVGLCGAGGYGEIYGNYLQKEEKNLPVEVVGIVEPFWKPSACNQGWETRKIPVFSTIEEFYEHTGADLMIISSPIPFHAHQSEYALRHGSQVLCEKPTAAVVSDAEQMIKAERETGKSIFIGFQLSFTDPILALKRDLLKGMYGRPVSGKCLVLWERDFAYYSRGSGWAGKMYSKDGVPIYDSVASNATAHYLHNLLFLLGSQMETATEVVKLEGDLLRANDIETFDSCRLKMETAEKVPLCFWASHATKGNMDPVFELKLEKATVYYSENGTPSLKVVTHDGQEIDYGNPKTEEQTMQKLIKTINWMQGVGEKPVCTVETTLPFMHVIQRLFSMTPFAQFPEEKIQKDVQRQRVYVDGLFEEWVSQYQDGTF